jgi:peptidoglycan/LPS O-acetylase OafA/YrhL
VTAAYALFCIFLVRHGQGPRQILCIPFFGFGLGVFLYRERPCLASMLLLCVLAALVPIAFTLWRQHGHPVLLYQLPWVGALFVTLFLLSGVRRLPETLKRLDKRLGDLSYAIYIGHGFVLVILSSLADQRGWLLYWLGVGGAFIFAKLLHATIEVPLRGARDRLRGSRV